MSDELEPCARFGHHPDAATDYECEIDALIGLAYERLTMGGHPDLEDRIARAMEFRTLQTPGELRWLNAVFRDAREIYARKPGWVAWPEDRLASYRGTHLLACATVFRDPMNFTVLVRWRLPEDFECDRCNMAEPSRISCLGHDCPYRIGRYNHEGWPA